MFYDEIVKNSAIKSKLQLFLLDFHTAKIEGKFFVEYFSSVKIIFSFKGEKLFVYGQNLSLKDLDKFETLVCGKIVCVSKKEVLFE